MPTDHEGFSEELSIVRVWSQCYHVRQYAAARVAQSSGCQPHLHEEPPSDQAGGICCALPFLHVHGQAPLLEMRNQRLACRARQSFGRGLSQQQSPSGRRNRGLALTGRLFGCPHRCTQCGMRRLHVLLCGLTRKQPLCLFQALLSMHVICSFR